MKIAPATGGKDFEGTLEALKRGDVKLLFVFGSCLGDLPADEVKELLSKAEYVVNIAPNESPVSEASTLVLPSASFAEKEGTYTNFKGRVQRFFRAFPPRYAAKDDLEILTRLARKLGASWEFKTAEEVFAELAGREPFFAGLSYQTVGYYGIQVGEKV
ncbi:MAG: hypothetical protein D6713_00685 [Deltaproteobacteria bacterium]|nr:MAG: hypothetical protein D6713_00685 [Deltaproteobacteria bacterium]